MPTLPTNPHNVGDSSHVNDHNLIVTALSGAVYASGQTGTVDLSGATVKGAGLDLVYASDFTSSSGINVDSVFTDTYLNYKIIITFTASTSEGGGIAMKLRASGTSSSTGYYWAGSYSSSTALSNYNGANQSNWVAAAGTGTKAGFTEINVYQPKTAAITTGTATFIHWSSGNSTVYGYNLMLLHNVTTAYDGFSITPPTAMTGKIKVYGYRN